MNLRYLLDRRARSVAHAFRGFVALFRSEINARIHAAAALLAVVLGLVSDLNWEQWRWIALCVGLVIASEAFNTALERVCDEVTEEYRPLLRDAKDFSAAGVAVLSVTALVIGLSVFLQAWLA